MSLQKLLNRNKKCDDNTDTVAANADRQHDPYVSAMLCRAAQKECNQILTILNDKKSEQTRAGVCKTLCPQLPDSNTVWL